MLELLISILMTLGIQFTTTDKGQIGLSSKDAETLISSEEYQRSEIVGSIDEIVITTGADPVDASTSSN